jgi:tRNA uracil 4-sulfurtransferase
MVTGSVVEIPVFRPLIGQNKEEIMKEARKIDTYNISILPEEDCCVRFLPKNPETKGKIKEVIREESFLRREELIDKSLKNIEKKTIF